MNKYTETLTESDGWNIIVHDLKTKDVIVVIYDLSNSQTIKPLSLVVKDENSISIVFGSPIEANRYRVVMVG